MVMIDVVVVGLVAMVVVDGFVAGSTGESLLRFEGSKLRGCDAMPAASSF
jgi:hypothetical protein